MAAQDQHSRSALVHLSRPDTLRPYACNDEHLKHELERIDQLVRAQTRHWRATLAASKPAHHWGMVQVTEQEVEDYLQAPFTPPGDLPEELLASLTPFWERAEVIGRAIAVRRDQTAAEVDLRLERLSALFGLDSLHRDVLLLCLLPELDARYRRLFAYLQDDATRTRPSVELVLQILHPVLPDVGTGRAVFAAGSPLVKHGLVLVEGEEAHPTPPTEALPARSVRLDDTIARFLLDNDASDTRLGDILSRAPPPSSWERLVVEGEQHDRIQALAELWRTQWKPKGAGATVLLCGPFGSGRRAAARLLVEALGIPLLVADIPRAMASGQSFRQLVDLSFRQSALEGALLCWIGCEKLLGQAEHSVAWERLVAAAERSADITLLVSEEPWEPAGRFRRVPFLRLDFAAPTYRARHRLWRRLLGSLPEFNQPDGYRDQVAEALANSFQLTAGQMCDALTSARSEAIRRHAENPQLTEEDLYDGCRRQSGRHLMSFARRIEPRSGLSFDDLVLPRNNRQQLRELRDRIRYRSRVQTDLGFERRLPLGRGLVALFTGGSGTGKTMAAELLAVEQGVDLYKVDLSAVVSKYVGETEKNLNRVFTEAEDCNALLFFDEADALFGKRGEVKEARDRWANLEVNYLLQRIEEYPGVVILTSNLRQNIDEAFLRRIQVIVEFPFPDTEARLAIWQGMLPRGMKPLEAQQLRTLAERFRLSGGSIKNIVLDAAYRAAAESSEVPPSIEFRHLSLGLAREYQKLGKPITLSEFGEDVFTIVQTALL